jgi:hypothetical protein
VFGSRHEVECNVTVLHLAPILVFGLELEWNGLVPGNRIFAQDAELGRSTDSVESARSLSLTLEIKKKGIAH